MQRIWGLLVIAACDSGGAGIDAPGGGGGDGPGGGIDAPAGMIDASPGVGEPPELMGMTLYHNQVRAMVQTPTPLPALQWDSTLAATAATWVAMCTDTMPPMGLVDHNAGRSAGHPYYIGENIYASGGTATAMGAVTSWAGEKVNYNATTGACNGGVCGHYTQIVWRTTLKVGCAIHRCAGLTYPSTVVCNYGPGGNSGGPAY
jgi:pathogenesis-related protein 1